MYLFLQRDTLFESCTFGILYVDDVEECQTLEDTDRELEINPSGKIRGQTAIPRGTYNLIIDYSSRFKQEMPHILDVPGFEGIRIHPGNTKEDTEGCILVGMQRDLEGKRVLKSRVAYNNLFKKLAFAFESGDDIYFRVR